MSQLLTVVAGLAVLAVALSVFQHHVAARIRYLRTQVKRHTPPFMPLNVFTAREHLVEIRRRRGQLWAFFGSERADAMRELDELAGICEARIEAGDASVTHPELHLA